MRTFAASCACCLVEGSDITIHHQLILYNGIPNSIEQVEHEIAAQFHKTYPTTAGYDLHSVQVMEIVP